VYAVFLQEIKPTKTEEAVEWLLLYTGMAWRRMYGTMLARAVPTVGCEGWLFSTEWKALYCAVFRTTTPPASEPSLKEAVSWLALLGGFLARKCDGHPGLTVVWRGLARLHDLTLMYQIFRPDS